MTAKTNRTFYGWYVVMGCWLAALGIPPPGLIIVD
jgi:hypothetical protein